MLPFEDELITGVKILVLCLQAGRIMPMTSAALSLSLIVIPAYAIKDAEENPIMVGSGAGFIIIPFTSKKILFTCQRLFKLAVNLSMVHHLWHIKSL